MSGTRLQAAQAATRSMVPSSVVVAPVLEGQSVGNLEWKTESNSVKLEN